MASTYKRTIKDKLRATAGLGSSRLLHRILTAVIDLFDSTGITYRQPVSELPLFSPVCTDLVLDSPL